MRIQRDTNGSVYVQWVKGTNQRSEACEQCAWVHHRFGDDDSSGTRRYLNVVMCNQKGNPGGNATDFPIYSTLSDEQVPRAFVHSVTAVTGVRLDD